MDTGPLTPGVTYEFWILGHNSEGEGPQSNHVTHSVPVGPSFGNPVVQ